MPALSPLRIPIVGIDKFSNKLSKIQKRVNKFGRSVKKAGTVMTASITAPVMLAGAAIFKSGYQFDKFMNAVQAKSTVAGKSIEDLRKKALDLGSSTSFSHIQAAEGMNLLAQAGYNTGQTFKAIQPVLNLATATNIELGQSADWLTNIMGGFQWGAGRAGEAAAILAKTTAKANVGMEDLSYTFADVGPIAKNYGATLKDVAAATGFLGNVGIKGTKAGTALKNMFTNLAKQTPEATKALKALGIQVDVNGKMRGYTAILTDLSAALGKVSQKRGLEAMATIFGKKSLAGVTALTTEMQKGNTQFLGLVDSLNDIKPDSLQNMVNIMRQGSVGAWDDMVSSIQGLGQAIADSGVVQMMSDFFKLITKATRALAKFSPEILKMVSVFAVLLAIVGPVLVVVGSLIPMITSLATSIAGAGGVLALVSNPIGWVVGGLIALTVATVALWKHLKPLRDVISSLASKAFVKLKPLLIAIKNLFGALWGAVVAIVTALQPLAELFGVTFGSGTLTGLGAVVLVLEKMVNLVTWLVVQFTKLWGLIAKVTGGIAKVAKSVGQYTGLMNSDKLGEGSALDTFNLVKQSGVLGLGKYTGGLGADNNNIQTNNSKVEVVLSGSGAAGAKVKTSGAPVKVKSVFDPNYNHNGNILAPGGL